MARTGTDVLHVDMDAFYAAVEILDDPSLAGKPVIVGGTGNRGVVASCSYEARAFGVRSAMPSTEARRLCPQGVFVGGRHGRYGEVSRQLHKIFADVTPVIEGISLDEAFLDVSRCHRIFGSSADIAHLIRRRVLDEMRLHCSVGVARTKLVAKLASEAAKPRASKQGVVPGAGVVVVGVDHELEFLHRHPVRALWGVGPKTGERLRRYGVSTVGDLAAVSRPSLIRLLGTASGSLLHDLAWGRDDREVEADRQVKSVSHEETFAVDDRDRDSLRRQAVRMADAVGARMREAEVIGRTVTIKVRFGDFSNITRSHTLRRPTASGMVIARVAADLLEEVEVHRGVRLLGVGVSGLTEPTYLTDPAAQIAPIRADAETEAVQLTFAGTVPPEAGEDLVEDAPEAARDLETVEALDAAVDKVRRRYGMGAVGPASITGPGGIEVKRPGDTQWGPAAPR